MKKIALLAIALFLFISGPVFCAPSATPTAFETRCAELSKPDPQLTESRRLWKIFDAVWKYNMTESPELATYVGYPGQNNRWKDNSLDAIARRKREAEAPLKAVNSIDRSRLDKADRLNYDLFKRLSTETVEGNRFPDELIAISQLDGVQQDLASLLKAAPRATITDYEDILARLDAVPAVIDQTIALLKEGLKAGITLPKITLRDVPEQIKNQMVAPDKSPLLEPFNKFPETISQPERKRLRERAVSIAGAKVVPAFGTLHNFVVKTYLPACREDIAWTALQDGQAWYVFNVRMRTTTHLTPQEIHKLGLSEVKRIRAEMEAVIKETSFQGSFKDFAAFLRSDARFFYTDAKELLAGYRDIAKRIDPELVRLFGKLPRLPYGITPVPSYAEKSQTTAYYQSGTLETGRPGLFFANTYNLKSRPKWEMEPLTLHEAVPGHHLQIALQQEMERMPDFRKHGGYTAYTEGWGLYSESLGGELGLYLDPYARFGQLTYEMWRAIRLVVDTGMHQFGWSRQQAIDFFKENTSKTDNDIIVEVDRYIIWPGQALAYKIGQLKIKELRERSRRELGGRFDVRGFHDAVLAPGSVPLDALEDQVAHWIAQVKAAARSSPAPPKP